MNTEEDEFKRIEREAKRRAAHELADTQVYTIHCDQESMCDQVSAELRGLRDQVQQLKSDLSEEVLISNEMLEVKDELLAALKVAVNHAYWPDIAQQLRAAIAKAERTTT